MHLHSLFMAFAVFYGPVNSVNVMLSQSVNKLTLSPGQAWSSNWFTSTYAHTFANN